MAAIKEAVITRKVPPWKAECQGEAAQRQRKFRFRNPLLSIDVGKSSDLTAARAIPFEPGAIVVFDRGYQSYQWFSQLSERGVFFVTRLRHYAQFEVTSPKPTERPKDSER